MPVDFPTFLFLSFSLWLMAMLAIIYADESITQYREKRGKK